MKYRLSNSLFTPDAPCPRRVLRLLKNDTDAQAVYLYWASTAPRNNKLLNGGKQDYAGVGGHLFAIAAEKSIEMGYGGY